jgi:hypothetical protein
VTVTLFCRRCLKRRRYRSSELPAEHECSCGEKTRIDRAAAAKPMIDVCGVCGLAYLYIDTNFNKRLGCLVLVAAAGAYLALSSHWWAILILVGTAGLDALAYALVGKVTICYKCLTEYRGYRRNPAHTTFELATAQHFADSK